MPALEPVEYTPTPVPITLKDMILEPNNTEERAPRGLISKPSDLSSAETSTAHDILVKWCSHHRGRSEPLVMTVNMYRSFWEAVFRVGVISTPLFDIRMKNSGQDDLIRSTNSDQDQTPAYLGITLNREDRTVSYYCKGNKRGKMSVSMIDFTRFEDKASAYNACVAHYDKSEIKRVETYNRLYLLTLARRRVVHFSKMGTQHGPIIPKEDWPTKMKTVVLASTIVDEMNTLTNTVAARGWQVLPIEDHY
ncbi:hypothetical protein NCS57_00284000 [Fusarium keratoplasticum]|uniref:Uncharacterized protein n=1 Tax=Fusarium keratoplasticum TaxID=1328300 RepID=A0ACC0RB96_9HYPO|nr:hypothetical protein NCS57_00284000 [Fusarium keratoplasticum]KAI8680043.1 hypothetical protein NCS57_00284000 [Fusarium keratoplasticum]